MSGITRRFRIGLAATVLAALPALASAQPAPDAAAPAAAFTGDRVEQRAHRKARLLRKFDLNGNGKLDRPERAAALRVKIDRVITRLDTDGSGTVSLAEASIRPRSRLARRFHLIDADGNGVLSKGEIRAARAVKLMPGKGKGRQGKRHGRRLPPV
jgi:hypothetical protein